MQPMTIPVKIFATSGSEVLAREICSSGILLNPGEAALTLSETGRVRFSNENLQTQPENVRGYCAVVVHTQTPPVNENLVELFSLLNSIKNAHPRKILLVFPYMPYSRSDRKNKPRISTMAKVVADIISKVFEIKNVLLLDSHASHVKHYFNPDADEVTAIPLILDHLEHEFFTVYDKDNCVLVFPDAGATKRFDDARIQLGLPSAYIEKYRKDHTESPKPINVVGDVRGKTCIMLDDEVLTGGTAKEDAQFLRRPEHGAKDVYMVAVHAPLMNKKMTDVQLVNDLSDPSSGLSGFVFTNSTPVEQKVGGNPKFKVLSVASLLAMAISRVVNDLSVSDLYDISKVSLYR
jgi:ribose-phosphate pyrophosphokinase